MVERDYLQPDFYHFNDDSLWLANQSTLFLNDFERNQSLSLTSIVLVDIGAGCGIIGIELLRRFPKFKKLILIEPQLDFEWFLAFNTQTFLTPELNDKTQILQSSIAEILKLPEWNSDTTLLLVSNPPYFLPEQGRKCQDPRRQICRHWSVSGMREWAELLLAVNVRRHTGLYWISPTEDLSQDYRILGKKELVQLRAIGDLQIE